MYWMYLDVTEDVLSNVLGCTKQQGQEGCILDVLDDVLLDSEPCFEMSLECIDNPIHPDIQ